jgi:hypothetical protein
MVVGNEHESRLGRRTYIRREIRRGWDHKRMGKTVANGNYIHEKLRAD